MAEGDKGKRGVKDASLQISGRQRQPKEVLTELYGFDRNGRAMLRGGGVT